VNVVVVLQVIDSLLSVDQILLLQSFVDVDDVLILSVIRREVIQQRVLIRRLINSLKEYVNYRLLLLLNGALVEYRLWSVSWTRLNKSCLLIIINNN